MMVVVCPFYSLFLTMSCLLFPPLPSSSLPCHVNTGNMPQLHCVDSEGIMLSGKAARCRRLTTDEQLALMGFPPSLRELVVWHEKNNSKITKWIGSGVPLHIGIAVSCSMLSFVTNSNNETAALIDCVNRDFIANSRRPRSIQKRKR